MAEDDHRRLGRQMNFYSNSPDIGQGLILWHPKGAMLRHMLEKFGQEAHLLNDYQWVYSPHIGRAELWETSGHLRFYKDSMYSPIDIDGDEYYLKPMIARSTSTSTTAACVRTGSCRIVSRNTDVSIATSCPAR